MRTQSQAEAAELQQSKILQQAAQHLEAIRNLDALPSEPGMSSIESNPRGIPKSPFIEDVEAHVGPSNQVEPALKSLQELLAKYRFMEQSAAQRKVNMSEKIPELQETILMVDQLQEAPEEGLPVTFELTDTLYAKAKVQPASAGQVYLWLGANVMLSYSPDEALSLLKDKLHSAKTTLDHADEDLDWLREQITVTEVNIARCYNYSVLLRRKAKELEEGDEEDKRVEEEDAACRQGEKRAATASSDLRGGHEQARRLGIEAKRSISGRVHLPSLT